MLDALLDTLLPGDADWPARGIARRDGGGRRKPRRSWPRCRAGFARAATRRRCARWKRRSPPPSSGWSPRSTSPTTRIRRVRAVLERVTGYEARPPQPLGYELPPFDESAAGDAAQARAVLETAHDDADAEGRAGDGRDHRALRHAALAAMRRRPSSAAPSTATPSRSGSQAASSATTRWRSRSPPSRARPLRVSWMERHFLHTQTFFPLGAPFVAVLAPPGEGELPDLDAARAFVFDGSAGLMLHLGTWHEFPFALHDDHQCLHPDPPRHGARPDDEAGQRGARPGPRQEGHRRARWA